MKTECLCCHQGPRRCGGPTWPCTIKCRGPSHEQKNCARCANFLGTEPPGIGELKDSHGTTPIPAEGSPASDPTRPIPAEGLPASSRIRTAPQRERSDTPDPRRGFIGELKDSHGTTPIPAEGSPASDPTRPIPAEGSPASSRIRTAPQRERSDTPDPRRGFIGELKDSHGTTARAIRHARSL